MFSTLLNWLANKEPRVTAIHSNKNPQKANAGPNSISTVIQNDNNHDDDDDDFRAIRPANGNWSRRWLSTAYKGFRKVDHRANDPLPPATAALFCYVSNFKVFWLMKTGPATATVSWNDRRKVQVEGEFAEQRTIQPPTHPSKKYNYVNHPSNVLMLAVLLS